jgi:four helix bundle protein
MNHKKQVRSFEDLIVWQLGIDLVKHIYLLTASGPLNKDFGLRDQIRRASVSIPTNIAEGFERFSRKEYLQFLNIAKGSAGELRSLLRVAIEIGYIEVAAYNELRDRVTKLSAYLFNQMKGIRQSSATLQ